MNDLKVGDRRRFFHPGTFGVMLMGTLKEIGEAESQGDDAYLIKFDDAHPSNGQVMFWTFKEFI